MNPHNKIFLHLLPFVARLDNARLRACRSRWAKFPSSSHYLFKTAGLSLALDNPQPFALHLISSRSDHAPIPSPLPLFSQRSDNLSQ